MDEMKMKPNREEGVIRRNKIAIGMAICASIIATDGYRRQKNEYTSSSPSLAGRTSPS